MPPAGLCKAGGETERAPRFGFFLEVSKMLMSHRRAQPQLNWRLLATTVRFYSCRAVVAISIVVHCHRSALTLQRASSGARLRASGAQLERTFHCQKMATFLGAQDGQGICFNLAARIIEHRIAQQHANDARHLCVQLRLGVSSTNKCDMAALPRPR